MLNRILTGILLAGLLFATLFFSHPLFIGILFTLIFIYSYYEWLNISCKNTTKIYFSLFLMLIAMCLLLEYSSAILVRNLSYFSLFLWLLIPLLLLFKPNYLKKILINNSNIFGFILIILAWYITVSIGSASLTMEQHNSKYLIFSSSELFPLNNYYLFIIILVSLSDISGYAIGKLIGKIKLCINISPNKTYEGFIASLIFPVIIFYYYFIIFKSYPLLITDILFMLLCCIYCTVGDLLVSSFKRCFNVKDTGNLLPGHGGLLDRLDSYFPVITIIQFWIFI